MSQIAGSTCPKHLITATDRMTNPSNVSAHALPSHQVAAHAAEAKYQAEVKCLATIETRGDLDPLLDADKSDRASNNSFISDHAASK